MEILAGDCDPSGHVILRISFYCMTKMDSITLHIQQYGAICVGAYMCTPQDAQSRPKHVVFQFNEPTGLLNSVGLCV
jgi:hypothetical protein